MAIVRSSTNTHNRDPDTGETACSEINIHSPRTIARKPMPARSHT
jgi:hypothetical protein